MEFDSFWGCRYSTNFCFSVLISTKFWFRHDFFILHRRLIRNSAIRFIDMSVPGYSRHLDVVTFSHILTSRDLCGTFSPDTRNQMMKAIVYPMGGNHFFNSLWPSDTIGWYRSGSTLAQVLTATSHYLNQCWLLIRKVLWHSMPSNFTASAHAIVVYNQFKNHTFKIKASCPWHQWVKKHNNGNVSRQLCNFQFYWGGCELIS